VGNPATQRNIEQLHQDGIVVLGPIPATRPAGKREWAHARTGGSGSRSRRLVPTQAACRHTGADHRGPTFEPIDPVRGITNRSSGKMGYAVARAALEAGAQVTLISGR